MTKVYPDYVSLEVDDHGGLFYKLAGMGPQEKKFGVKYRVAADGFVRVEDELAEGRAIQEQAEAEQQAAAEAKRGARRSPGSGMTDGCAASSSPPCPSPWSRARRRATRPPRPTPASTRAARPPPTRAPRCGTEHGANLPNTPAAPAPT